MSLPPLRPGERLAAERNAPIVCLPWLGPAGHARLTLDSLLSHSPSTAVIVLVAAGGSVPQLEASAVRVLLLDGQPTYAAAVNAAASTTAGDLAVVAPGTVVGPEWLERLGAAAHGDSVVVSASALCEGGGPLSVPGAPGSVAELAQRVADASPRAYPRVGCAGAHCVYLRRPLLDRLGGLDPTISEAQPALDELSRRAVEHGMLHVVADDVYVGRAASGLPVRRSALCELDEHDEHSVVRRSRAAARAAVHGLSVTIDGRALGPFTGGTQIYTIQLVLALARSRQVRLRVVTPPDLSDHAARAFASEPSIELLPYERAADGAQPTDVVHRPQQVFTEADLALLHLLGERVVVGQQDLIAYRNPAYHASIEDWEQYRRVTWLALAAADRVVFFSDHARADAVSEDLVDPRRADVTGVGAAPVWEPEVEPAAPAGLPQQRDLLVCLGADYQHKNRPFALLLADALRRRHGFSGCLVLAGAHVPHGSSRAEEQAVLEASPGLADVVTDLGSVDDGARAWLYRHARAVVYPSTYEGFGLVPFEAARDGSPCLFAPVASLPELAGPDAATLVPWDAEASAAAVAPLLTEGPERRRHVDMLRRAAQRTSWVDVVDRTVDNYRQALTTPRRAATPRAWRDLRRETYIAQLGRDVDNLKAVAEQYQQAYHALRSSVGIGLPLVAEGGLLSRAEQRGLMRIASRRSLHSLVLGPIGALGRLDSADVSGRER